MPTGKERQNLWAYFLYWFLFSGTANRGRPLAMPYARYNTGISSTSFDGTGKCKSMFSISFEFESTEKYLSILSIKLHLSFGRFQVQGENRTSHADHTVHGPQILTANLDRWRAGAGYGGWGGSYPLPFLSQGELLGRQREVRFHGFLHSWMEQP